uniref:PAM2 domain-containing protein n=1 Tax=Macrostomum lignano TaxID=282301 RepID=A0A1I8FST2_9PLAT
SEQTSLTDQPFGSASALKPGGVARRIETVESAAEDQRQPRRRRPRQAVRPSRQPLCRASLGHPPPGIKPGAHAAPVAGTPGRPPTAVTPATSGPGAPAEASVPNSVAQTATTTMATTNRRSLVAATPGPSSVLSAAAQAETVAEASTSGFKTAESPAVRSGDEPEPAAEQLLPNRVESGSPAPLFQQSAAQQQRDAQPLSPPKSPPMVPASSTAETIKTTTGVDAVMTAEASSCSETGPSSHSSPKQQQHQRRPSQWRQPPVGQEIAQTFSQPTVVLSSGNKPPAGHYQPADAGAPQSPGASLLVPRLPVAAEAARRMSQFRATRRSQHP